MKQDDNLDELISRFLQHDRAALARIITLIENDIEFAHQVFSKIYKFPHNSYILGITGFPGTGKSTLISKLAEYLSGKGFTIGIILVDPSSISGGGAFLGDRIRMKEIILNPNIFIRSVASRGSLGGLSKSTFDIAQLYDAYGFDYIIIETVGAGQDEIDIANLSYSNILLVNPESGDSIQFQKAGIFEIGDILVINKADLGGDFLKINLNMMLDTALESHDWRPPIVKTIGIKGEGIPELVQVIQDHKKYMESSGRLAEKKRSHIRYRIQNLIESILFNRVLQKFPIVNKIINEILEDVVAGSKDIYSAVFEILQPILEKIEKIV